MTLPKESARDSYAHNFSQLRGLARHADNPRAKLKALCADRQFWKGDHYTQPASFGAQAALRACELRYRDDLLAARPRFQAMSSDVFFRRSLSQVFFNEFRMYKGSAAC